MPEGARISETPCRPRPRPRPRSRPHLPRSWIFFAKRGFGLQRYNDKFKPGSELSDQIEKEMRHIDDIDLELALLNSVLT